MLNRVFGTILEAISPLSKKSHSFCGEWLPPLYYQLASQFVDYALHDFKTQRRKVFSEPETQESFHLLRTEISIQVLEADRDRVWWNVECSSVRELTELTEAGKQTQQRRQVLAHTSSTWWSLDSRDARTTVLGNLSQRRTILSKLSSSVVVYLQVTLSTLYHNFITIPGILPRLVFVWHGYMLRGRLCCLTWFLPYLTDYVILL